MTNNIEVEIRSFISKEKYGELLEFFMENAKLTKEDYQETHYLKTKHDLRIQKNNSSAKIWMKSGKIHDDMREEIEIHFSKDAFPKIQDIFNNIDIVPEIKWFRQRSQFQWKDITVSLDYTKGYGYIIELEKMCSNKDKDSALKDLKKKMQKLKIKITPKEEFEKKYVYYKENWESLIE